MSTRSLDKSGPSNEKKKSLLKSNRSSVRHEDESNVDVFIVVPPDGGWGWIIVFGSFMCNFFTDGLLYSYGKLLPFIVKSINITYSQATLIGSIQLSTYFFIGPVVSAFVNKYGFRSVAVIGSIISTISLVLASYTTDVISLGITYGFFGGIGYGFIYAPSIIILSYYFEKYRALATGIAVCGSGAGTLVISPLMQILLDNYGLKFTIQIQGVFTLICALCALLYKPLYPIKIISTEDKRVQFVSNVSSIQSFEMNFNEMSRMFASENFLTTPRTSISTSNLTIGSTRTLESKRRYEYLAPQPTEDDKRITKREKFLKFIICCKKREKKQSIINDLTPRPLYRNDIFFSASLILLPEYIKTRTSVGSPLSSSLNITQASVQYQMSMTRSVHDLEQINNRVSIVDESQMEKKNIIPAAIKNAIKILFDFTLFKSITFNFTAVIGFLVTLGAFTPYIFLTDRANHYNLPKEQSIWLISIIGLTNTIARLIIGFISFIPNADPGIITGTFIFISGIATIVSGLYPDSIFFYQMLYCVIFGIGIACYSTLKPIIYVKYLGLENLTNAFGLVAVFMGLGALVGTPISSLLKESTGDYILSFIFAGTVLVIAGIILINLKFIREKELKLKQQKNEELNENDDVGV